MSFLRLVSLAFAVALMAPGCGAEIGGPADDGAGDVTGPDNGGGDGGDDSPDSTCSGDPCDLFDQCGCEPGQACALDPDAFESAGTTCREADPTGDGSTACDQDSDCARGYACLGDPGQCRRFCDNDGDCGGGRCGVQIVYDAGESYEDVPGVKACTKTCKLDAAEGSGCPEADGLGCRFYGSAEDGYYTDCTRAGDGGDAASCATNGSADCAAGFECVGITYTDDSVRSECRQMCVRAISGQAAEASCAVGSCRAFGTPLVVGDVEYGVCF